MATKSSSRSKVHPYRILRNWIAPHGSLVFWLDRSPEVQAMYNATIAEELAREKNLCAHEQNIPRNHK